MEDFLVQSLSSRSLLFIYFFFYFSAVDLVTRYYIRYVIIMQAAAPSFLARNRTVYVNSRNVEQPSIRLGYNFVSYQSCLNNQVFIPFKIAATQLCL